MQVWREMRAQAMRHVILLSLAFLGLAENAEAQSWYFSRAAIAEKQPPDWIQGGKYDEVNYWGHYFPAKAESLRPAVAEAPRRWFVWGGTVEVFPVSVKPFRWKQPSNPLWTEQMEGDPGIELVFEIPRARVAESWEWRIDGIEVFCSLYRFSVMDIDPLPKPPRWQGVEFEKWSPSRWQRGPDMLADQDTGKWSYVGRCFGPSYINEYGVRQQDVELPDPVRIGVWLHGAAGDVTDDRLAKLAEQAKTGGRVFMRLGDMRERR